jgi:tetratricopeptide (TPR) repeat protein
MRWPARAVVLAVLLCGAAAPARAEDEPSSASSLDEAKAVFSRAEKAYGVGRFEEALADFERAYALLPLPGFLFNLGQCHRNLGNWEQAGRFYQEYLDRQPRAANADKVRALLAQMKQKVAEQQEARARAAAAGAATDSPPRAATASAVTPSLAAANPSPPLPASATPTVSPQVAPAAALSASSLPAAGRPATPLYRRWWLWTVVGVVAVGASAGIAAAVLSPSVSTEDLSGSLGGPIDARR